MLMVKRPALPLVMGSYSKMKRPASAARLRVFSLEEEIPDHSTICRFRNLLAEKKLLQKLLNEVNGQLAYAVNDCVTPYIGAAYEHEFDGKARATAYGYDIRTPSLTGGTGMGANLA